MSKQLSKTAVLSVNVMILKSCISSWKHLLYSSGKEDFSAIR